MLKHVSLLMLLLMFPLPAICAEVYLKDGGTIECQTIRKDNDGVHAVVNDKLTVDLPLSEVDMNKTFRNISGKDKKPLQKNRAKIKQQKVADRHLDDSAPLKFDDASLENKFGIEDSRQQEQIAKEPNERERARQIRKSYEEMERNDAEYQAQQAANQARQEQDEIRRKREQQETEQRMWAERRARIRNMLR